VTGSGIITSAQVGDVTYSFAGKDAPVPPVTSAPANLKVVSTDTGSAVLSWTAVPNAVGYRVYRTDLSENVSTSFDGGATVQGLKSNTSYSFAVAAESANGTVGPKTDVVVGQTKPFNLTAPTGLKCVAKNTTTINCKSNPVVGANRYGYYVNGIAHGSADSATAGYDIVGLKAGTTYRIKTNSDNDTQGVSAGSAEISVKTK
jgi:hypothetical protein